MKPSRQKKLFSESSYSELVDFINTFMTSISLGDNLNGQIIEGVEIPAGVEVTVSHRLKQTPKYRIMLREFGGDINVTDGEASWTDSYVTFRNTGADAATITVLLMRG